VAQTQTPVNNPSTKTLFDAFETLLQNWEGNFSPHNVFKKANLIRFYSLPKRNNAKGDLGSVEWLTPDAVNDLGDAEVDAHAHERERFSLLQAKGVH
jgi:hypothetical protein